MPLADFYSATPAWFCSAVDNVDDVEFGVPVTVGGVTVRPGDLIHADQHGVVKVPLDLASRLPDAIRAHDAYEKQIIEVCQSPDFSLEALTAAMKVT